MAPEITVFGPTEDVFSWPSSRRHKLTFRFRRNDLGKARFYGEPLRLEKRDLLLQRYDTRFRFRRVRP
jgi:hypothetical protein